MSMSVSVSEKTSSCQLFAKLPPVPLKVTVSLMDHSIFAFFEFFANHFIISFDFQKKLIMSFKKYLPQLTVTQKSKIISATKQIYKKTSFIKLLLFYF
jgi:hypothetical protein